MSWNLLQFESFLKRVGWPNPGDSDSWMWWFKRTWTRLEEREWFDVLKADDDDFDNRVRIAMIALRWIVEDYCAIADDFETDQPYWDDWMVAAGVDRSRLLAMARRAERWKSVEDFCAEVYGPDDSLDDDEICQAQEYLESELEMQAMAFLADRLRPVIYRGLKRVWDDEFRLASSLWSCAKAQQGLFDEPLEPAECDELDASLSSNQASAINHYERKAA